MARAIKGGIEIVNLRSFLSDLRRAEDASGRELTAALKEAGRPVLERTRQVAAVRSGRMRGGYVIRVRGTSASIQNAVPYSAGAEWGLHGKWSGFTRYPAFGTGSAAGRGRFAWRAVVELQNEVARIVHEELTDIVQIHGWARPRVA